MITSFEDCALEVIGMSRKIASESSRRNCTLIGLLFLGLSGYAAATPATTNSQAAAEERLSVSRHIVRGGRENPAETANTNEQYDALVTQGIRSQSDTRGLFAKPGAGSVQAQSGSYDYWFYEADVILFNDDDLDGYYRGIDLLFDVDTIYSAADVYAVLYLSYEGGPWNEYAVTEDFTIFGASGSDEYVLVSELQSGYPTGSYDILIELFDAYDGRFLTDFGPIDTSELSYLPLEDYNRDAPIEEVRVVVSHGGGGAMDAWLVSALLLILVIGAFRRIWRRRHDMLVRIDSPAPCWQSHRRHDEDAR